MEEFQAAEREATALRAAIRKLGDASAIEETNSLTIEWVKVRRDELLIFRPTKTTSQKLTHHPLLPFFITHRSYHRPTETCSPRSFHCSYRHQWKKSR
jgi:uncharacterized damage-inducible protein DinB